MSEDMKNMQEHLDRQSRQIYKNVEIVDVSTLPAGNVIHISKDKAIKKFIPVIGHRQNEQEDRTVPRVCVSATLMEAVSGYAEVFAEYLNTSEDYKGGYYIYRFNTELALAPNEKLVCGSGYTKEMWLVSYDEEHLEYKADIIGKFFIGTATIENEFSSKRSSAEMYIEAREAVALTRTQVLDAGYYKATVPFYRESETKMLALTDKNHMAEEITKVEFDKIRKEKVPSLNLLPSVLNDW